MYSCHHALKMKNEGYYLLFRILCFIGNTFTALLFIYIESNMLYAQRDFFLCCIQSFFFRYAGTTETNNNKVELQPIQRSNLGNMLFIYLHRGMTKRAVIVYN